MVQLQVMQRKGLDQRVVQQEQDSLQHIREEISSAVQAVSAAEDDVGILRGLVSRKGFPADFGAEFSGQRPEGLRHVDDDDEDDRDRAGELAADSDLGVECSSG
jgi:hypothetical protein